MSKKIKKRDREKKRERDVGVTCYRHGKKCIRLRQENFRVPGHAWGEESRHAGRRPTRANNLLGGRVVPQTGTSVTEDVKIEDLVDESPSGGREMLV